MNNNYTCTAWECKWSRAIKVYYMERRVGALIAVLRATREEREHEDVSLPVAKRPSHHLSRCALNAFVFIFPYLTAQFSNKRKNSKENVKNPNWLCRENVLAQRALSGVLENKVYQFVAHATQLLACITGVHGAHRARHAREKKNQKVH